MVHTSRGTFIYGSKTTEVEIDFEDLLTHTNEILKFLFFEDEEENDLIFLALKNFFWKYRWDHGPMEIPLEVIQMCLKLCADHIKTGSESAETVFEI